MGGGMAANNVRCCFVACETASQRAALPDVRSARRKAVACAESRADSRCQQRPGAPGQAQNYLVDAPRSCSARTGGGEAMGSRHSHGTVIYRLRDISALPEIGSMSRP